MNIKKASWFCCIYSVYSPPLLNCLLRVQLACIAVRPNRETKENSERESTQKHKRDKTPFTIFQFYPLHFSIISFLSILIFLGFTFSPQILFCSSQILFFIHYRVILLRGCRFFCKKIPFLMVGKWKTNWFLSGFFDVIVVGLFIRVTMMLTLSVLF